MIYHTERYIYIKLILLLLFLIICLLAFIDLCWKFLKDYKPSTNLYQYKINNFPVTICWVSYYILGFTLLLYVWRMTQINTTIDLKDRFKLIKDLFITSKDIFLHHNHLLFSLYIFIAICLSVICILALILFHKNAMHHIFLLHFYIYYNSRSIIIDRYPKRFIFYQRLCDIFSRMYPFDIVLHYLWRNCYKWEDALKTFNYPNVYIKLFDKLQLFIIIIDRSKIYKLLYILAPYLVFAYDCLFNNWVISHFFMFIIIYFPITLTKKITHNLVDTADYINDLLNEIYYHEISDIYCIPEESLPIINNYLLIKLGSNQKNIAVYIETDVTLEIYLNSLFNKEEGSRNNLYTNGNGIRLLRFPDGEVYRIEEELDDYEYILAEKWLILHENNANK